MNPKGDGRMTIRAGYGIFYDTPQMFFDTRYSNSPPWGQSISLAGSSPSRIPRATYPGGDPFPALSHSNQDNTLCAGGCVRQHSASHQSDVSAAMEPQRSEAGGHLAVLRNLLSETRRRICQPRLRPTPPFYDGIATIKNPNTNARRQLYLQNKAQGVYYSTIGQYDDAGTANYNGVLISVQRRAKAMNLVGNYTYAHCLSEAETTELTGPSYIIPGNRHASYSNCDSDRRQVANVSLILNAPTFTNHLTNMIVGGWALSTILTARSGGYGTVTTGADDALSGIANQTATTISSPYATRTRFGASSNLSPAAFAIPALGTYSLQRPLSIVGPGSYELDMALLRTFKITERQSAQFRWEVFNVPNEAIFLGAATGGTNANIGAVTSSTFGSFTTADNPRIMQFALKYIF